MWINHHCSHTHCNCYHVHSVCHCCGQCRTCGVYTWYRPQVVHHRPVIICETSATQAINKLAGRVA